ncbi:RNA polymerase sigma factor [Psychrobacillus vulpis]|uniref:RNA polymerase sigma factor n=1 Tax=Psychrobacillus vulpis TaxID=2325572 RepID=UPI00140CA500|nr:RNA polymerase sigma factor [Psychrobacillus vulpis]
MDTLKLIKKAQKGNITSFELLITHYKQAMYYMAKTILKNDEDCADAIQESIIKAFLNIHKLKEPSYFKTWLIRIVMNESYHLLRKSTNIIPLDSILEPSYNHPMSDYLEIEEALDHLSNDHRQLLILFYTVGLSIKEIADVLDLPENTVKSKMHRARQKMKDYLTEKETEEHSWTSGKSF